MGMIPRAREMTQFEPNDILLGFWSAALLFSSFVCWKKDQSGIRKEGQDTTRPDDLPKAQSYGVIATVAHNTVRLPKARRKKIKIRGCWIGWQNVNLFYEAVSFCQKSEKYKREGNKTRQLSSFIDRDAAATRHLLACLAHKKHKKSSSSKRRKVYLISVSWSFL